MVWSLPVHRFTQCQTTPSCCVPSSNTRRSLDACTLCFDFLTPTLCLIFSLAKLRVVELKKRVSESSPGSVSSYHCLGLVGEFGGLTEGEGMGYSFATTGEFVIPACRVNPFCNRVNFDESEFEDNTVFDFVCGRCKVRKSQFFKNGLMCLFSFRASLGVFLERPIWSSRIKTSEQFSLHSAKLSGS